MTESPNNVTPLETLRERVERNVEVFDDELLWTMALATASLIDECMKEGTTMVTARVLFEAMARETGEDEARFSSPRMPKLKKGTRRNWHKA